MVEEASAVIGLKGEIIIPMQGCNHIEMCRFEDPSDNNYDAILGHLENMAESKSCLMTSFPAGSIRDWQKLTAQ